MKTTHVREWVAEFLGTAFLLAAIIGSGIMAQRLSADIGVVLLANSLATGGALVALILTFGPVSGAHFNPAVTLCDACLKGLPWKKVPGYVSAQVFGAFAGTGAANLMFGLPAYFPSQHPRHGPTLLLSEFIATFGLLAVVWGCSRRRAAAVPFAVAAYIVSAYWFTASTSFANPAVTLARAGSNTFAGIRLLDAPAFIAAQLAGAIAATLLFKWLAPALPLVAKDVMLPHSEPPSPPESSHG